MESIGFRGQAPITDEELTKFEFPPITTSVLREAAEHLRQIGVPRLHVEFLRRYPNHVDVQRDRYKMHVYKIKLTAELEQRSRWRIVTGRLVLTQHVHQGSVSAHEGEEENSRRIAQLNLSLEMIRRTYGRFPAPRPKIGLLAGRKNLSSIVLLR